MKTPEIARIRNVLLGLVGGGLAGLLIGLCAWAGLRWAGWPVLVPAGAFKLLRWGGAGALFGAVVGAWYYAQHRRGAAMFTEAEVRAALGDGFLPLVGGWKGPLVLGAFFGGWIGMATGGFCGICYSNWAGNNENAPFLGAMSGVVLGIPAGLSIGALLGAVVRYRSGAAR